MIFTVIEILPGSVKETHSHSAHNQSTDVPGKRRVARKSTANRQQSASNTGSASSSNGENKFWDYSNSDLKKNSKNYVWIYIKVISLSLFCVNSCHFKDNATVHVDFVIYM